MNIIHMKNSLLLRFLGAICLVFSITSSLHAAEVSYPKAQKWSWTGHLGTYDRASAQRGLQVFIEVCHACHGLSLIKFRSLEKIGYNEEEIKALAAGYTVNDGISDDGSLAQRAGKPEDSFPEPFVNEDEARAANNGTLPPDLSLIVDARAQGRGNFFLNLKDALLAQDNASGADYLYALMTGYSDPPESFPMLAGMQYNDWFSGHQIAMPQPIYEDSVTYEDGTAATIGQISYDVSTFLAWASEPNLEERRFLGAVVIGFFAFFIVLLIITKRIFGVAFTNLQNQAYIRIFKDTL